MVTLVQSLLLLLLLWLPPVLLPLCRRCYYRIHTRLSEGRRHLAALSTVTLCDVLPVTSLSTAVAVVLFLGVKCDWKNSVGAVARRRAARNEIRTLQRTDQLCDPPIFLLVGYKSATAGT
jgi:hypothetical protein